MGAVLTPPDALPARAAPRLQTERLSAAQRRTLWTFMVVLVVAMLAILVWLAGRYEASQLQNRVERDALQAASDLRSGLTRGLQDLQSLQGLVDDRERWRTEAAALLREHREWVRLEWRDLELRPIAHLDSSYRTPLFDAMGRGLANVEIGVACTNARRSAAPQYSHSYFMPQGNGQGLQLMELCVPVAQAGQLRAYLVATHSLPDMLGGMVGRQLARSQEVALTEADNTRLAIHGSARRVGQPFGATQLLDLPGNPMMLRVDSWRAVPDLFPNVLTALVTAMSIALLTVLGLLGRDMRRRQRAESDLAEALAFRKAMEDSLVTGLRARDLQGRITYVNPAFCQMVGFEADELLGHSQPAPYWPPELVDEYSQRQAIRLAGGNAPPREGYESVFMRKDGSRFPVLIIEAPLINAQGEQTGWMSAFLDISEQRRVEELSRASQERLQATARLATVGEMASLLSHELNQPLAAIASYANGSLNLIHEEPASNTVAQAELRSSIEGAMQRIAEQADRAGKVIKGVHDFVRRRERERESVQPQQLVEAVMPLVQLQARKLRIQVQTRIAPELPALVCDRTMVEQVLLNLARNAMQAMEHTPLAERELRIDVMQQVQRAGGAGPLQHWVEFRVTDRGPGIAPDVAAQLFTPFFTTKSEGMGLGLSLCRTVAEQHGGDLGHEHHPQRGTIFRFRLPLEIRLLADTGTGSLR